MRVHNGAPSSKATPTLPPKSPWAPASPPSVPPSVTRHPRVLARPGSPTPVAAAGGSSGLRGPPQRPNFLALKPWLCSRPQAGPWGRRGSVGAPERRGSVFPLRRRGLLGGAKKPVPSTYSPLILVQPLALETAATHGRAVQGRIWPPALPLPSVPEPGGPGATPGAIPAQRRVQLSVPAVCPCLSTLCCSRPGLLGFPCKPELPQWWWLVLPSRNPLSKSASQKSHIPVWESYRVPCKGRRVFGNCCKCLGGNLDCSLGTHSPGSSSCCEAVEGFLSFPKPARGCAQTSLKLGLRRSPAPALSRGGAQMGPSWAPSQGQGLAEVG